jgi:hypothetical protein
LRGVSKDGSRRLWPILRDAAKRPLLRMRTAGGWPQMCAWTSAFAGTTTASRAKTSIQKDGGHGAKSAFAHPTDFPSFIFNEEASGRQSGTNAAMPVGSFGGCKRQGPFRYPQGGIPLDLASSSELSPTLKPPLQILTVGSSPDFV